MLGPRRNALYLLVWSVLQLGLCNELQAQLILLEGREQGPKPFVPPDASQRIVVKRNQLNSSLRYGYLAERPDAQSLRRRTEYNIEGYPITVYDFSAEGQVERKLEYEYDAAGVKILKARIESYKTNGDLQSLLTYQFDSQGRIIDYREVDAQGHEWRRAYTFDPQGRPLLIQEIEPDGLPGGAETYTYHSPTQVSMVKTDIAGDVLEQVHWTLDAKGRKLAESHYVGSDAAILLYSYRYKYDERGRLARRDKVNRNEEVNGWETWSYDAAGRVLEHQLLETGEKLPILELFVYDRAGRKIIAKTLNPDGTIFQWYRYTHDSLGTGAGFERLNAQGGTELREIKTYNSARQILREESKYSDGSGDETIVYRYSDDGLPLDEKHLSFGKESAVFWYVHEKR